MAAIYGFREFEAATDELSKGAVAVADAASVASDVTANWSAPGQLTFDSFVRGMSKEPYAYPAQQVRAILQLAWPYLPANVRERLSKRENPVAPTPSLPPATAPVKPSPHFPQESFFARHKKAILIGGGILAAGGIGLAIYKSVRKS